MTERDKYVARVIRHEPFRVLRGALPSLETKEPELASLLWGVIRQWSESREQNTATAQTV